MGYLKIICAILIWSSLGIFIRKIHLPNHYIIFYTAAIAGAIQFILLVATGIFKQARLSGHNSRSGIFLVLSPLCFIANALLFYYAFRNTTIANAVLTHYTAPVFVAFLAPVLLKERISGTTWLSIILSSAGLWLILGGNSQGREPFYENSDSFGVLAGAASGFAYAMLILIIRRIASLYSSLFITFIQNGVAALLLLPFVLKMPLPPQALPYVLGMGIFHSTIAPLLYVQGFRSVTAHEAAIFGYFEPVGAIILALVFFGEIPGLTAFAGGGLILFSGYLIVHKKMHTG